MVVSRRRPNIKLSRSVLSVCRAPVMSSAEKTVKNQVEIRRKSSENQVKFGCKLASFFQLGMVINAPKTKSCMEAGMELEGLQV